MHLLIIITIYELFGRSFAENECNSLAVEHWGPFYIIYRDIQAQRLFPAHTCAHTCSHTHKWSSSAIRKLHTEATWSTEKVWSLIVLGYFSSMAIYWLCELAFVCSTIKCNTHVYLTEELWSTKVVYKLSQHKALYLFKIWYLIPLSNVYSNASTHVFSASYAPDIILSFLSINSCKNLISWA